MHKFLRKPWLNLTIAGLLALFSIWLILEIATFLVWFSLLLVLTAVYYVLLQWVAAKFFNRNPDKSRSRN